MISILLSELWLLLQCMKMKEIYVYLLQDIQKYVLNMKIKVYFITPILNPIFDSTFDTTEGSLWENKY
jgi:hypothetical protein